MSLCAGFCMTFCSLWELCNVSFLHRLDGLMPEGVEILNNSFAFTRPLERNDSGVYRCEVINDIGLRSQVVNLWVQGTFSWLDTFLTMCLLRLITFNTWGKQKNLCILTFIEPFWCNITLLVWSALSSTLLAKLSLFSDPDPLSHIPGNRGARSAHKEYQYQTFPLLWFWQH